MVRMYHPPRAYKEPPEAISSDIMYSKRAGTSGIRGQLYETKLLSLLYFRAIHDDTIQEFQLAANMDKIGAFDDICFKAEVKGHNKPVTVFIQAKHRENKKLLKIDLATYFDSYMKIRQNFGRDPRYDWFFNGKFNETECFFIIFTNANVDYSDTSATSGLSAKLNDILGMGGMVKQPNSEENIEYVTKKNVKDQITSLAKWIVGFIHDDKNLQLMQSEELFLRYHLILAQKVVDVSDIQPLQRNDAPPYRIASFRQDFYDNNEEYIVLFRDTLYLEVIKRRRMEPTEFDMPALLTDFLADPTDATRLSKLIGTVVTYNNGQLEFDKQSTKTFRPNIKPMDVSQSIVNKAVELAAIEILSSVKFKVPATFGNKDLMFKGNEARIEKRICYLALKIKDLLYNCKSNKIVTVDESLEDGFLQLNGGIAGAIGNIFVLDEDTKLMKITDNSETLGTRAKNLYTKLKSEVDNLHEYKFCFNVDKFPKLSFGCSHYEEKMARDFLNKILVYCNQADEDELQEILKNEIEDIQRNQPNYFQAKTDAILLRYYDKVQKWWMLPQQASYLSPRINLFRQLIDDIIKDPLMSSINLTYMSKIKQHAYTFTEDAVRSLNLQDQHSSTIIVAENCVLTVVKVLQHLNNKDHAVLDVEYIASLPTNDLNALRAELMNTNKEKVLLLVCDKIDSKNEMHTLKNIAEAVKNKTNIIITDAKSLEILMIQKYFPEADKILHDKKFSLIDLSKESQKNIFKSATVVFPGVEIRLEHLVRGWPKTGLTSAGKADAAGVAAVTDKPIATTSSGIGMEHRGMVEQKKRLPKDLESLTRPSREAAKLYIDGWIRKLRSADEADAAGVAAVTDEPTATGSRAFGMEHRGVVEQKKRFPIELESLTGLPREAEELYIDERIDKLSNFSLIAAEELKFNKDPLYYDMSGKKYLIILSHTITFMKKPSTRNANDHDVKTLTKVFGNHGFITIVLKNLKYESIIEYLTNFTTEDHSKTSCVCITILTNSAKGGKVHAADRPYLLTDLITIFEKERSLINKPKLFFVQACRGDDLDAGNIVDSDSRNELVVTVPTVSKADFLVLCSIGEDLFAYRNIKHGSWMIQALCHVIQNHHEDLDVLDIINLMNMLVVYEKSTYTPFIRISTLTKRLKFKSCSEG